MPMRLEALIDKERVLAKSWWRWRYIKEKFIHQKAAKKRIFVLKIWRFAIQNGEKSNTRSKDVWRATFKAELPNLTVSFTLCEF